MHNATNNNCAMHFAIAACRNACPGHLSPNVRAAATPICCPQSSCHVRILCAPNGMPQPGAGCDEPCVTPRNAQCLLAALASSSSSWPSSPSRFHADLITCSVRLNNTVLCTLAASHQSNNSLDCRIQQLHGTASNLPARHLLVNTATSVKGHPYTWLPLARNAAAKCAAAASHTAGRCGWQRLAQAHKQTGSNPVHQQEAS